MSHGPHGSGDAQRTNDAENRSSHGSSPLTSDEIRRLPAVVDPPTAARVLGIGRTKAYELLRTGEFPAPALRLGRRWRIPTAGLRRLLHLPSPRHEPTTTDTPS